MDVVQGVPGKAGARIVAGHGEAALLGGPLGGVTGNERQELSYPWSPASCSWLCRGQVACPEPRSSLSMDTGLSFAAPHVVGGLHETQLDAASSSMSAELMRGFPVASRQEEPPSTACTSAPWCSW